MQEQAGNWIVEGTSTNGTGDITLTGAGEGFAPFSAGIVSGPVWYVIQDGDNREAGKGTFDGNNTIARTEVHSTLIDGVLTDTDATAINLSGNALIANTFNATPFRGFLAHGLDFLNPHNVLPSQQTYDPLFDKVTDKIILSEALIDHANSIEQRVASNTGVINGGIMSGGIGSTQITVSSGNGEVFDSYTTPNNTSVIELSWVDFVDYNLTFAYDTGFLSIFINSVGAIATVEGKPSLETFRDNIYLGVVYYSNSLIVEVLNSPSVVKQTATDLYDVLRSNINIDGLSVRPVDNQLQVYIDSGSAFFPGSNWLVDRKNPNSITIASSGDNTTPISFKTITQTGLVGNTLQNIPIAYNPTADTITLLTGNDATIHRLYKLGIHSSQYFLLYGQNLYTNTATAKENLFIDDTNTIFPPVTNDLIFLGYIGVDDDAVDFNNLNRAWIISASSGQTTSSSTVSTSHTTLSDRDNIDQHTIGAITDLQTELDGKLKLDGSTPMTGDLSLGLNFITNVLPGEFPGDAATFDQLSSKLEHTNGVSTGQYETIVPIPALAIDVSNGNVQSKSISADSTFTFTGWTSNASAVDLYLTVTGTPVVTFTGVTFKTVPVLTAGLNVLTFTSINNGSVISGFIAKDFS